MNRDEIMLYVHIPFCIRKCLYCDFLSYSGSGKYIDSYFKKLYEEIEYYGNKYGKNGLNRHVSSVFIGGGTPSVPDSGYICRMMEEIKKVFVLEDNVEISIECNPGTVTEEKLSDYIKCGVNRLSLGLQSTNGKELEEIGRIHTYEQFLESYYTARNTGFKNINIDLMSALPYQTPETYKDTLEKVLALEPEHISAYSLILEEDTPLYRKVMNMDKNEKNSYLPDEDSEREMYYITSETLKEKGYFRYEISNYSKKGCECRHNCGYWQRKEYLGLGLGASSFVEKKRYKNISDLKKYIDSPSGNILKEDIEILSKKDEMEEFMYLGLRMIRGIEIRDFEREFNESFCEIYGKKTEKLRKMGLIDADEENVRLTKKGLDFANMVFEEYLID